MKVLVVNAGSSSMKFILFETKGEQLLGKGLIERINTPKTYMRYSNHRGQTIEKNIAANSYEAALSEACLALVDKTYGVIPNLTEIKAIGHRVVHGGATITDSVRITPSIKQTIMDCFPLAPLHNPPNHETIEASEHFFPNVPMVAVFDTAFHQTMPPSAYTYAIPAEIAKKHKIRRYGFHGTSHQYVANRAAETLNRPLAELKIITAHLGNGSSIAAIDHGNVIDTSMGMTPLEGLVMGTRCGDMDPAIVLMLRHIGYSLEEVDRIINKSSGLLGLAGIGSNDMRDIIEAIDNGNEGAHLALDVFIHRLVKYIGAYTALLNGLDALVFTAGIGENSPRVRSMACKRLSCLGIELEAEKNKANDLWISKKESNPAVLVIPTNEELMIARETVRLLT